MLSAEVRDPLNNVDAEPTPGDILIRVKSANHPSCEDLEFHTKNTSSVIQIKETIQRLSSHHPEVKEQRLIYAGHLLEDTQVLKEILCAKIGAQYSTDLQQPVTIHLACTSKYLFNPPSSSSQKTAAQKPDHLTGGGLPQQPIFNGHHQGFAAPPNVPQDAAGIPADYMTLHQAYVEQMTAYMNHWHMQQNAMMAGMFYQMPPAMGNYNVAPQPAPAEDPPAPAPVINRPQENAAAPVARAVDDDENQRDLLDWMYTFSRVILILSVVYFYSSFSRFILVVLFTGLVMILQRRNGAAEQVPRHVNGGAVRNPPPPAPAAQPEPGLGEERANGDGTEEGVDGNPAIPVMERPPPPPQRNLQDIAWTFLTTFFTSLIPETYQNN